MRSFYSTAKATHIFSAKKLQHICVSLDVNFNESLTNDIVSFEQLGPAVYNLSIYLSIYLFTFVKECYILRSTNEFEVVPIRLQAV